MAEDDLRPGTLYVCATPLGNLGDLSERARLVLAAADLVAAERPEHTRKLLSYLGIPSSKLRPAAESTPDRALEAIVDALRQGATVAMVTDAGTPGISDPGPRLVRLAVAAGCPVSPVPGASALCAALSISGFDTRRILMEGFLPRKEGARRAALSDCLAMGAAVVLFESPRRLCETLRTLAALSPVRPVMLLREATKLHEEVLRGTAQEILEQLGAEPRGEATLVIAPPSASEEEVACTAKDAWEPQASRLLAEGLSPRDAVRALMVLGGLSKSRAFALVKQAAEEAGSDEGSQ